MTFLGRIKRISMVISKRIVISVVLLIILIGVTLFFIERLDLPLYLRDIDNDGNNWFDHKCKIWALKSLIRENSNEGLLYYLLAIEYEKISSYYEGNEKEGVIRIALHQMQKAQRLQGNSFRGNFRLSRYHERLGDIEGAIAALSTAANGYGGHIYLGHLYMAKGEYDNAINALKGALSFGEGHEAYYELGKAYEAAGDHAKAAENYKSALQSFPSKEQFIRNFTGSPVLFWVEEEQRMRTLTVKEIETRYESQRMEYQKAYERVLAKAEKRIQVYGACCPNRFFRI